MFSMWFEIVKTEKCGREAKMIKGRGVNQAEDYRQLRVCVLWNTLSGLLAKQSTMLLQFTLGLWLSIHQLQVIGMKDAMERQKLHFEMRMKRYLDHVGVVFIDKKDMHNVVRILDLWHETMKITQLEKRLRNLAYEKELIKESPMA